MCSAKHTFFRDDIKQHFPLHPHGAGYLGAIFVSLSKYLHIVCAGFCLFFGHLGIIKDVVLGP
jgi:hypothetical protein